MPQGFSLGEHSLDETQILTIWKKGLKDRLKKIKDYENNQSLEEATDIIFSDETPGGHWNKTKINRKEMKNILRECKGKLRCLLKYVMIKYGKRKSKHIIGAKFPVHFYYVPTLYEWFPSSKVINMLRDPRAILASEIKKWEKPFYPLEKGNPLYNFGLIIYVVLQWTWSVKLIDFYKERYNDFYVCKYEDLVMNPEFELNKICNFLGIDFENEMLDVYKFASSYGDEYRNENERGFKKTSLEPV